MGDKDDEGMSTSGEIRRKEAAEEHARKLQEQQRERERLIEAERQRQQEEERRKRDE